MAYLTENELQALGLKGFGSDVQISDKASIYFPENLEIGNHVRIDDFCVISAKGRVCIGDYVHIGAFSAIYGGAGVELGNYSGMSSRCTIYSESDDFSGESLIHPFFPNEFKPGYIRGKVMLESYAQLGAGCTVLPNCNLRIGAVVGAHSLVLDDMKEWSINAGIPARFFKSRTRGVLKLMEQYQSEVKRDDAL